MSDKFSLKDHLFNKKSVTYFADLFYVHDSSFPKDSFIKNVLKDFPELELKERISRMRIELERTLPGNYPTTLRVLLRALPAELDPTNIDDDFGDFILAPLGNFIEEKGCNKKYLEMSLSALRECTKRFSVEHDMRYFINEFPKESLDFLTEGIHSKNYHVRRLSSECLRPKLPWSININFDYMMAVPLLDVLFADTTRYVTRSVANHMNDISKINPEFVVAKLLKWKRTGKQDKKEMEFIINHSLRTLVKKGDKKALSLLGYSPEPKINILNFSMETPTVKIGETLEFSFEINSLENQNLMIDYIVHHRLKSGFTNPKVFKIKKGEFQKGELISINKKQPFRIMTTKKLYPGEHLCEIQINGTIFYKFNFKLVK